MKNNLNKIPTQKLIFELIKRKEIRPVQIGFYADYDLKPKYGVKKIESNEIFIPTRKEAITNE